MNKRVKWIIIAILAIVIVTIAIISIRNEMLLHYKIEEISEYNYFVLEQNKKYGVIDKKGNVEIMKQFKFQIHQNQYLFVLKNMIKIKKNILL